MGLVGDCGCCYLWMSQQAGLNLLSMDKISSTLDDALASSCKKNDTIRELVYKVACAKPASALFVGEYLLSGELRLP